MSSKWSFQGKSFFFPSYWRDCQHYNCSWVPSFIMGELDTGRWGLQNRVRKCAVLRLLLFSQQEVQIYRSLPSKSKDVECCVFLYLSSWLQSKALSPFSPICRFPLLNSIGKHYEFLLPLWPLGSFYSFFIFWSTWKVYSDIPPFFFYYLVPVSTLWCLCILFIDILLFSLFCFMY